MNSIKINKIVVGKLQENCYIIEKEGKAIIIDPGDEYKKIEKEIINLNVVEILITHHHFDHIGALDYFETKYHLKHNENTNIFNYEVISTPGHSKDSLTFYFPKENIMFTGDFLFKGTIGRTDLPTGDIGEMKQSLIKISKYPDNVKIYPGHGPSSILEIEKVNFSFYENLN